MPPPGGEAIVATRTRGDSGGDPARLARGASPPALPDDEERTEARCREASPLPAPRVRTGASIPSRGVLGDRLGDGDAAGGAALAALRVAAAAAGFDSALLTLRALSRLTSRLPLAASPRLLSPSSELPSRSPSRTNSPMELLLESSSVRGDGEGDLPRVDSAESPRWRLAADATVPWPTPLSFRGASARAAGPPPTEPWGAAAATRRASGPGEGDRERLCGSMLSRPRDPRRDPAEPEESRLSEEGVGDVSRDAGYEPPLPPPIECEVSGPTQRSFSNGRLVRPPAATSAPRLLSCEASMARAAAAGLVLRPRRPAPSTREPS